MPEASVVLPALLVAVVPSLIYLARAQRDRPVREGALDHPAGLPRAGRGRGPADRHRRSSCSPGGERHPAAGVRARPAPGRVHGDRRGRSTMGVLLIVLVRFVRDEFDDVLDGVIYGAAIGAGFGAAESFLYVLGGTRPAVERDGRRRSWSPASTTRSTWRCSARSSAGRSRSRPSSAGSSSSSAWPRRPGCTPSTTPCPLILSRVLGQPDAAVGAIEPAARRRRQLARPADARGRGRRRLAARGADPARPAAGRGRRRASSARPTTRRSPPSAGASAARPRSCGRAASPAVVRLRRRYAAEGELAFHKWHLHGPDAEAASRRAWRRAAGRDPPPGRRAPGRCRMTRRTTAAGTVRAAPASAGWPPRRWPWSCSRALPQASAAGRRPHPRSPPSVGNAVLFHLQLATDIDTSGNPIGQGTQLPDRDEGRSSASSAGGTSRPAPSSVSACSRATGSSTRPRTSSRTSPARTARTPGSCSRSTSRPASPPATTPSRSTTTASPTRSSRSRSAMGRSTTRSSAAADRRARSRTRTRRRSWWSPGSRSCARSWAPGPTRSWRPRRASATCTTSRRTGSPASRRTRRRPRSSGCSGPARTSTC